MRVEVLMGIVDHELLTRTAISIFCGFVIGLERHLNRKPIDVRTSILICMGTMTFIFLNGRISETHDPSRVLGQVVTGIGFLGAGAIITRQGLVLGMTSAAVVWVLAAIGCAIGFGHYGTGVFLSIVTVGVLTLFQVFEDWVDSLRSDSGKTRKSG